MSRDEIARARSALWSIDAGCDRQTWARVGMAAKAAGLTLPDFTDWSSTAGNFGGEADCRTAWKSFKEAGRTGPATLFGLARDAGWRDEAPARPRVGPRLEAYRQPPAPEPLKPRLDPAAIWARCAPVTAAHPYIAAKKGNPQGLRLVPEGDPLTVAGLSMAGALVVPVLPLTGGEPVSLQFVAGGPQAEAWKAADRPSKLNLPGAPVAGVFIVGTIAPERQTFIVEGIGTAWAVHRATGCAVVVCFGWGNVRRVAVELRRLHPAALFVLCPDRGKEGDAEEVAREVGAAVAAMPADSPSNFDAADFAEANGDAALAELLAVAGAPYARAAHPLAQFIELEPEPKPPRWVLPGLLAEEMMVIAGPPGVGKSSVLVPLALTAAGLHREGDPLAPKPGRWRHVIFVSEDTAQFGRILAGAVNHGHRGIQWPDVHQRVHVAPARRMAAAEVAEAAPAWREWVRVVDGVELPPLVIIDTRSAVVALKDENQNAEGSEAVAALRQAFPGWPLWVIAHVANANAGNADVATLAPRGAGSWVGDGAGTAFVLPPQEGAPGDVRRFALGKTRNAPRWRELRCTLQSVEVEARDCWGEPEMVRLEWSEAEPVDPGPQAAKPTKAEREAARRDGDAAALALQITQAVREAWREGVPLSRSAVRERVPGNTRRIGDAVDVLLGDGHLFEVEIPSKERVHPKKSAFLVPLTPQEREVFIATGTVPLELLVVPPSWRKHSESFVPGSEPEAPQEAEISLSE